MIISTLMAFLHFLAAFGLVSTVILERALLKPTLSAKEVSRLGKVDGIYGLSAILVLIIGFLRVFYFEKGSEYYFSNPIFHLKLTTFVIIGLLSIYPTIKIVKWRKPKTEVSIEAGVYKNIIRILNIELALLVILLFSASLMARMFI